MFSLKMDIILQQVQMTVMKVMESPTVGKFLKLKMEMSASTGTLIFSFRMGLTLSVPLKMQMDWLLTIFAGHRFSLFCFCQSDSQSTLQKYLQEL